ncbi:MAG TPA: beta-ketoacyl synthase N-terminal-like domain-containing protein [Propionicimonas sp.]|nr:beta-ketoacyl synthase N-terminal-like domain-containing protein [Propionicimonas sp.]
MTGALDFSLDEVGVPFANDLAEPVAIIGMAGRFPMAETLEEYWDNLVEGRDCHRRFPPSRARGMDLKEAELCEAGYLSEIAEFDHSFFDISRREASLMDPNQRIFLEEAHHALEDAGLVNTIRGTRAGAWIGFSKDLTIDFARHVQTRYPELAGELSVAGNMGSVIASRIAYSLDLRGPAVSLDTACSSGLYAMLSAVRALQRGEVPVALVGSVKVNVEPIHRGLDDEIGIRSSDHRTKTFDRRADGISSGEGACALVLKRLSDALADGDRIRAVIKGIAANQDGKTVGITAPNPQAQTELLLNCWETSGADLRNLVHIEAHGTGTRLGDPVEVSAITTALANLESGPTSVGLGSVKPNIGHLDHLAPLASVAKSVLMLEHGMLVPTISFEEPNTKLEFVDSPLYVNDLLRPMPGIPGTPLVAVSAFGLAGTNVHVLLEAPPTPQNVGAPDEGDKHAVVLSARTEPALRRRVVDLVAWYERHPSISVPELAAAARAQSGDHGHRLACVATNRHDLMESLESWLGGGDPSSVLVGAPQRPTPPLNASVGAAAAEAEAFAGGALLPTGHQPRLVSLPGYPFAPVMCWPDDLRQAASIPTPTTTLLTEAESIHRLQLTPRTCWALLEHKVGTQYVLPGTALIDVIVRLLRQRGMAGPLELSDIFFLRPLSLGIDDRADLWIILRRRGQDEEFEIVHAAEGQAKTLVTGRASGVTGDPEIITVPLRGELTELPDDRQRHVEVHIGRHWTDIGRWIGQFSEGTFFARFDVPKTDRAEAQESECYPPLVDRAFNALNAHFGQGTYLPFSIARLIINRTPDLSSMARLTQLDAEPEGMTFDVALMNLHGEVSMHAFGYRVRQIEHTSRPRSATRHEPYWARIDSVTGADRIGSLALLGADDDTAPYADAARALGITSVIVGSDSADIAELIEPGGTLIDVRRSEVPPRKLGWRRRRGDHAMHRHRPGDEGCCRQGYSSRSRGQEAQRSGPRLGTEQVGQRGVCRTAIAQHRLRRHRPRGRVARSSRCRAT